MNFKMYLKTVLMTAVAVIGLSACDDNDDEPVAPPSSSEETLTFKVTEEPGVEGATTTVSIRPSSDDVEYYANVWTKEKVGAVSGSELSKMILEAEDFSDRIYWGEELLSFDEMKAGTYYVVAMAVENGKAAGKPKKKPFIVKEKEPAQLTLTAGAVTASSVAYTVASTDANESYIVSAISKSEFDSYETTTAFMASDVDYWEANGGLSAMLKKGNYSGTVTGLEEKTEYVLYAYYCDAEGTVTTGLVTSVFTTGSNTPTPPADGPTINPQINMVAGAKYWPEDADSTDVALEISLYPSSDAAHTSFAVIDPDHGLSDEELVEVLLAGGKGIYYDKDDMALGLWKEGEPFVFVGIAIDASGNAGPLCKIQDTAEIGKTIGGGDTPTPPVGDGPTVSAEYEWVDGSLLGPQYAGKLFLMTTLTTNGAHTYSMCFKTTVNDFPDSEVIAALLSGDENISVDPEDGVEVWGAFNPGDTFVYTAVATDASGNPGPLLRQTLVAGETPDDPNPPTPSGDYAKYLGEWTVSGLNKNGAATSFTIEVEPNVSGKSYKVWGWTTSQDKAYNAPVIWDFENGKVVMKDRLNLGMDDYNQLPFCFVGFLTNGTQSSWLGEEGYRIASMSLGANGKTMDIEWNTFTAGETTWTFHTVRYGLYREEADGSASLLTYNTDAERYVVSNLKIEKAAVEEPTAAYKAYLGNWTLTSRDADGNDVAFNLTISQKRANKSFTVAGWSGAVGTEYPCELTFNADGSVSLYEQSNLGSYTHSQYGTGTVFTGGMILDPADGQYYFWGGTEEVLTGKVSGKSLTLTGKTISGTDNTGAPYSYDFIGYRYGCKVSGGILAFDGGSWPLFPATLVSGGTSAKTKSSARLTATFERVPQMKLSNVLNAVNVYASNEEKLDAEASFTRTIHIASLDGLSGVAAKKTLIMRRELLPSLNMTPCRK